MSGDEQAVAIVKAFFAPERRERYLSLLASPRGRERLRDDLAHLRALDPRFLQPVPRGQQNAASLAELLAARGAPSTCYLLAEDKALDGQTLRLVDALRATVGRGMAAIISCVPGELAFYEGESAGDRYILARVPEGRCTPQTG